MYHSSQVTAIIENHVQRLTVLKEQRLFNAPVEFLFGHSFPGVNWDSCHGNSCCCMILRGEDITATPCNFCTKCCECFNQHGGLDRHVQTSSNLRALQWFTILVSFPQCHQTRHFVFCNFDLPPPPISKRQVFYFVRNSICISLRQFNSPVP